MYSQPYYSHHCGYVFVYSLFIVALIVCGGFVLGPCFVMLHFIPFLNFQLSLGKRELVALLLLSF